MKKIKIEGDLAKDLKDQLSALKALRNSVCSLSLTIYERERNLWDHVRSELPNLGANCTLEEIEGGIYVVDRMNDVYNPPISNY